MYSRILVVSAALILCSCQVLEDRDICPCLLHLEMDGSMAGVADSIRIWVRGEGFAYETGLASAGYSEGVTIPVTTQSGVYVTVMDSGSAGDSIDGTLMIPLGTECPEVFDFRAFCNTSGASAMEHICLHKNHCRVFLTLPEGLSGVYSVRLDGNVCGYAAEGGVLKGEFSRVPHRDTDGRLVTCIPRQTDASLTLKIAGNSGLARVFALGNYMEQIGYDWTAEDLDDVEVTVDYALSGISLRIEGWPRLEAEKLVM